MESKTPIYVTLLFCFLVLGIVITLVVTRERSHSSNRLDLGAGGLGAELDENAMNALDAKNPEKTTQCCWCVSHDTKENSVRPYTSRRSCEQTNEPQSIQNCRRVTVLADQCSLVRVSEVGQTRKCVPNPLKYRSITGEEKEIAPPMDFDLPCRDATLLAYSQGNSTSRSVSSGADKSDTRPEVYCTCGRDPNNQGNCLLQKVSGTAPTTLATRTRQENQSTCSRNVCMALFRPDYGPETCPAYVQGQP